MTSSKLIPKAIAYSRNVRTIENHSFQHWLNDVIAKEDELWWARKDEDRPLASDPFYQKADWSFRKFLAGFSALIP